MSDPNLSQKATSASTTTFKTALVFNAAVFGIELVAFTILRPRFKAIYEPRTYIPAKSKRVKSLGQSLFTWPWAVWKMDYRAIIPANGMDAYFFVRFLRMAVKIFLPMWFLSWAVLLPVNSVGISGNGSNGLNQFNLGNLGNDHKNRYAAHIILIYIFTGWIFYNIKSEMANFTIERQKYLISPAHAQSVQASTVLITSIPAKYLNEKALYRLFKDLPGGVRRIWINRDLKELPDLYNRRLKACNKLESAETSLLNAAAKLRLKANKKKDGSSDKAEAGGSPSTLVPKEKRPTHRLGFLPLTGKKVDTIDWAREEIKTCTQLLEDGRRHIHRRSTNDDIADNASSSSVDPLEEAEAEDRPAARAADAVKKSKDKAREAKNKAVGLIPGLGGSSDEKSYPPLSSAFILFNRQIAAHMACQVLNHHQPYRMSDRYIEVGPEDVVWGNLGLNPYEQRIRKVIAWAMTVGLVILWTFPVAFIGALSNVATLTDTYHWLAWINKLPSQVIGIIQGILPPILLAVLMMLLPIILRLFARFEGVPTYSGIERSLMTRYFIFLVIHSFLVVTLSSGIIASLPGIAKNPSSIATMLAEHLPQASIFFLTYVILQGLSGSAGGFLQAVPLAIYYVKLFLLGSTPRSVYGIKYTLRNVSWGTLFPTITLLIVIALGYSIIAPIINGLACATFFMFYMLYKYLFLYQFGQPAANDTGGLFFPQAIQHIFVGLYVEEVCLCALYFLQKAIPQGALMAVLIIFTAGFNILINNSYGPLLHSLPLSLADKTWTAPAEETGTQRSSESSSLGAPAPHAGAQEGRASSVTDVDRTHMMRKQNSSGSDDAPVRPALDNRRSSRAFQLHGFEHPAASRPQRIVWLPQDQLGLAEEEERGCREAGLEASTKDAVMDEKGHVNVTGAPPGEEEEEEV